ncbi:hypothetical protein [Inhella proteolytica]|uniref:Transmembrane protein n=1 Tax=Inhella proteolytica TaxID=2795029 RepID=A0A931J4D8_9BURK|nr:hypothetical protein [Inhella proteolytica]MBH9575940.1 hypothetical protein [Inhella proteolytica]
MKHPATGVRQRLAPRLLWIDSLAALGAGLLVFGFAPALSGLYGLPVPLLQRIAAANLLYGSGSLGLACWRGRPRGAVQLLALANAFWAGVCVLLALQQGAEASGFGLAHLLGEAVFVGTLGALEWRYRRVLAPQPDGHQATRASTASSSAAGQRISGTASSAGRAK